MAKSMTGKMGKIIDITKTAAKAAKKVAGKGASASVSFPAKSMGKAMGKADTSSGGFDVHDSMSPHMDPNKRC